MKKTFILTILFSGILFAFNFNTASKSELMKIKGIGSKKAEAIIKYRKTHKIKNADDLKNIKGFGNKNISKIKNQINSKSDIKKQLKQKKSNKFKKSFKNKIKKGMNF